MTPVEARNTSFARQPTTPAADSAISRTESAPARPVKALALPLFTAKTRAVPPGSSLRHQSTGADDIFDFVSTPAICVPGARTMKRTSGRSRYLMPAWPVASRTPAKGGRLAKDLGVKGDIWGFAPLALDADFSAISTLAPALGAGLLPIFFVTPKVAMAFLLCAIQGRRLIHLNLPAARIRPNLRSLTRGGLVLISPP